MSEENNNQPIIDSCEKEQKIDNDQILKDQKRNQDSRDETRRG